MNLRTAEGAHAALQVRDGGGLDGGLEVTEMSTEGRAGLDVGGQRREPGREMDALGRHTVGLNTQNRLSIAQAQ